MGFRSGDDSVVTAGSGGGGAFLEALLNGGGGSVVTAPLVSGAGCSGHTTDLVSHESLPSSLAPVRSARVPVGRPCGPIRIRAIYLYANLLGGDSCTGMTLIGSSLSSSSATTTSTTSSTSRPLLLPLFLPPSDTMRTTTTALAQPGTGTGRWPGLRVPLVNRLVVRGREMVVVVKP
jgi:hypothetical protein